MPTIPPIKTQPVFTPIAVAALTFLLAIAGVAAVLGWLEQTLLEQKRAEVSEYLASPYAIEIQRHLERALSANYALAALVRLGLGEIPDFAAVASEMLPFYPGVAAFQLAPDGVIRQSLPLVGNEQAIGRDLFADAEQSTEALLTRDTGWLTLAGPFDLFQGGLGAVGRLPVFLDDGQGRRTFWGFTSVLMRFPEALDGIHLAKLREQGFDYELWRIHPKTGAKQVIAASSTAAISNPVEYPLTLPNGRWTLSVSPVAGWRDPAGFAWRAALGLAFSLLLAFLAWSQVRLAAALRNAEQTLVAHEQAEVALRASEARFRSYFDSPLIGIAITSIDKGWLEINDRLCQILGYSREALRQKTWAELTHPEDLAADVAQFERMLRGESDSYALEKRFVCADGRIMPTIIGIACVRTVDARPDYFVALVQDMTAHRQAEETLRESEEKFRLAFDNANTGMCLVDLQGRLLQVNDKMSAIFGYSKRALESMNVNDLAVTEDAGLSPAFIERALHGTEDSGVFEKRYRHQQGHLIHCLVASSLVRDAQQQPKYFISQVQDMTQRRQIEEALRISEERYRILAENALDVIWTMEPDGRISYVSPAVEKVRGFTPEEALRQPLEDILTPDSQAVVAAYFKGLQTAAQAGRAPENFRGELEYWRKDGSTLWCEVIACPLHGSDGRFVQILGVTRDISERKRYEQELQQARDVAEIANRAKSTFLAHMSHEIRTPLNVVLGLAQVLNREPLAANQRDMVERIQLAGQSLLALINDLLDLSKIEANQLGIERLPFDLATLLDKLKRLMEPAAQAKGLAFRVEALPESLGPLVGDPPRLEQVLVNLLGNAVKFTEQGQVTLSVRTLQVDVAAVRLHWAVCDTGIGIPHDALDRLFTPFTQAEEGIARRFGGTGLGLSISKRLVELMGGEIGVTSQLGQGSTFWFELPLERASEGEAGVSALSPDGVSPAPAGPLLTGTHFLVVDDSAMNRDLVERALALEGATATLAANGQQAVQILQTGLREFAAVLMDVRMPVMDGLTATRLIREELGLTELPVIALTAGVLAEEQDAARAAGVNAILFKPLNLDQMATLLLKWVKPRPPASNTATAAASGQPASPAQLLTCPDAAGDFPDISGIDRLRAAETLSDNRDLFLRLLARFADEFADAAERTTDDLARGERETPARRMHTLRGNAGSLGALDLMVLAEGLEAAIERGETNLEMQIATLDRQLADLIAASVPWREAPTVGATAPTSLESDRLDALRADLRRRNLKARQRFEELRPALLGALGEIRTDALGCAIRGLRFHDALAVLDDAAAGGEINRTSTETRP
jgi:PAS domain S-box-containing protein